MHFYKRHVCPLLFNLSFALFCLAMNCRSFEKKRRKNLLFHVKHSFFWLKRPFSTALIPSACVFRNTLPFLLSCRTAAFIFRLCYFSLLVPYRSAVLLRLCSVAQFRVARSLSSALRRVQANCAFFPLHCRIYISTRSIICQNGIFYMRLCDPACFLACISARMVSPAPPTAYSLMRSRLTRRLHIRLCDLPSTLPTAY